MSAAKHNRPARARRLPSVKRSILTSFLLFTLIAVTLFWLCTAVFLDDIYRAFKRGEIRSASAQIEQKLLRDDWETAADAVAERNNCCAIVYQMYGDSDGLELLSAEHLSDCAIHRIDRVGRYGLFRTAQDAGGSFLACYRYDSSLGAYRIEQDGEEKSADTTLNLISARIVQKNGSIYFILLNSAVTPVNTAVKTIMALLAAITLILLLLSALLAWVLSRRIAAPMIRISYGAEQLARRSYDLKLRETGYREAAQLADVLNHAAVELSKVDRLCRELIANISHDLRTPLTMIIGYAEVMRDLPGENKPENVQVIIDEANRLTSLVNDVLDLSKFEAGTAECKKEPFDLTQSVQNAVARCQKLTASQGYALSFTFVQHVTVISDEGCVMQVLYNLIGNALTHTGSDLSVQIEQTVIPDKGRVRISVTDTGDGIPPDQLPHLFERYYRGSSSHRRPTVGSGLGLSIVRTVMARLGGTYGVLTRPEEGSTFWIELPVERSEYAGDAGSAGSAGDTRGAAPRIP